MQWNRCGQKFFISRRPDEYWYQSTKSPGATAAYQGGSAAASSSGDNPRLSAAAGSEVGLI